MRAAGRLLLVTAGAALALAVAASAHAQGKGKKSKPPSSSTLPSSASGPAANASPLSWLDDASLLAPGTMSLTVSAMRWSGADLSEVDFPIVDASIGLTPRFQIGASVPRIVGSADGSGPVGGVGERLAHSSLRDLLDPGNEVADLARAERRHGRRNREPHAHLVGVVGGVGLDELEPATGG